MDRQKKQIAGILDMAGVARQGRGRAYLAAAMALLLAEEPKKAAQQGAARDDKVYNGTSYKKMPPKNMTGKGEVCNE